MDYRGYTTHIVRANRDASTSSLGVKLGRYCIANDFPVREVAEYFGVSRMTVYKWFVGEWIPRKKHSALIEDMLKKVGVLS